MNSIEIAKNALFGSLSKEGLEFDGQKLPDEEELNLMAQAKKDLPNEEIESRMKERHTSDAEN